MGTPKVIVGANARIYINNKLFGVASSLEFTLDHGIQETYGLDNSEPLELAETKNRCTGSLHVYRLRGDGGLAQRGLMTENHNVKLEKYSSMVVVDRFTDMVLFQCDKLRFGTQQWSMNSKGLMEGMVQFTGIAAVTS